MIWIFAIAMITLMVFSKGFRKFAVWVLGAIALVAVALYYNDQSNSEARKRAEAERKRQEDTSPAAYAACVSNVHDPNGDEVVLSLEQSIAESCNENFPGKFPLDSKRTLALHQAIIDACIKKNKTVDADANIVIADMCKKHPD